VLVEKILTWAGAPYRHTSKLSQAQPGGWWQVKDEEMQVSPQARLAEQILQQEDAVRPDAEIIRVSRSIAP